MNKLRNDIKKILKLMEVEKPDEELDEESEVNEEGEAASTETETTTPDSGTAGIWTAGLTRGPGNQLGNTKWADTVGAQLKRSKGNMLK